MPYDGMVVKVVSFNHNHADPFSGNLLSPVLNVSFNPSELMSAIFRWKGFKCPVPPCVCVRVVPGLEPGCCCARWALKG